MSQSQTIRDTSKEQGVSEAARAREELYDTLGQLRVQLDFAQRIDNRVARVKHRLVSEKREHPLAFGAVVVSVAALSGVAVWAVVSKIARSM